MEKIRQIIKYTIISIYIIMSTAAFGNDYHKYDLLLSIELYRDVIYQYEPLQVKVTLENKGASRLQVLPLKIGSIDTIANARASLVLDLKYPNGRELKTILLEPYYGPISSIERFFIEETTSMPGAKLETSFYLSSDWGWKEREKELLFSIPGEYVFKFEYYPFAKDSIDGRIKDRGKTIYSNEVVVSVLKLSENDEECWNKIRSNKLWFLLYDPQGKNVDDFKEEGLNNVINVFDTLLKECSSSIFYPYLKYTKIMAETKKVKILEKKRGEGDSGKKAFLSDEEILILKELSDKEKFSYREEAEKLLMESVR